MGLTPFLTVSFKSLVVDLNPIPIFRPPTLKVFSRLTTSLFRMFSTPTTHPFRTLTPFVFGIFVRHSFPFKEPLLFYIVAPWKGRAPFGALPFCPRPDALQLPVEDSAALLLPFTRGSNLFGLLSYGSFPASSDCRITPKGVLSLSRYCCPACACLQSVPISGSSLIREDSRSRITPRRAKNLA